MRESVPFGVRLSVLRPAFIAASVAWTALLPIAPLVAIHAHGSSFAAVFTAAMYGIGHIVCHQIPARSFQLAATPLPVCARCTGIYLGAAMTAIVAAAAGRANSAAAGLAPRTARLALIAGVLPTAVTLAFEWTTGITPSNTIRFVAGLPIGIVVAWLVARYAL
jgi:uncharacterized membrane protein